MVAFCFAASLFHHCFLQAHADPKTSYTYYILYNIRSTCKHAAICCLIYVKNTNKKQLLVMNFNQKSLRYKKMYKFASKIKKSLIFCIGIVNIVVSYCSVREQDGGKASYATTLK